MGIKYPTELINGALNTEKPFVWLAAGGRAGEAKYGGFIGPYLFLV